MKLATNHQVLQQAGETYGTDFYELSVKPQPQSESPLDIDSAGDVLSGLAITRGGNRLRALRQSEYLGFEAAQRLLQASELTQALGLPFTRFVTINWELAGLEDSEAAEATGKLVKRMTDWARKRESKLLWAWAREIGRRHGSHVHLLISCPAELPVARMWRRWIKGITGRPYLAETVLTRTIGRSLKASMTNPAMFRHNLFKVTAYCCKGVHPDHQFLLGDQSTKYGGWITGKRSAICQHLLAEMRTRHK